jgi:hypothetical protein
VDSTATKILFARVPPAQSQSRSVPLRTFTYRYNYRFTFVTLYHCCYGRYLLTYSTALYANASLRNSLGSFLANCLYSSLQSGVESNKPDRSKSRRSLWETPTVPFAS